VHAGRRRLREKRRVDVDEVLARAAVDREAVEEPVREIGVGEQLDQRSLSNKYLGLPG